ncbi:MAG: MerC domain-containing protein [Armatimonadetes bacterium]|nr:MerC domain-containing protein [Armatimonadota bacterium]
MAKFDADRAGAIASFVCAVHCAAVGLLVTVLPLIGLAFLHEPWVEVSFYAMAVVFGVWAAVRGWRLHRSFWPGVLFATGLSLVGFGHWMAGRHAELSPLETLGHLLSAGGGLTLVAFHVLNARMTKTHACSCHACVESRHEEAGA